jgi:hypothetical protein
VRDRQLSPKQSRGLAAGCIVINAVGMVPAVVRALRRCSGVDCVPFVFSTLADLERVLSELVDRGPTALQDQGRKNREWMDRNWAFARQWDVFWKPTVDRALQRRQSLPMLTMLKLPAPRNRKRIAPLSQAVDVSVVIPHGGVQRLPQLTAALVSLRQRNDVGEVIVAELGERPIAEDTAARWANRYVFVPHTGPFERATSGWPRQKLQSC